METVGIFVGPFYKRWDENTIMSGMGGSETWAHEMALGLAKKGYDVTLYAYPEEDHDPYPGYHMVTYEHYFDDIYNRKYDHFIYSRMTSAITPAIECKDIIMMIHDVCMITPQAHPEFIGLGIVDKYCYLSEFHKQNLLNMYKDCGLKESDLHKVSNGYSEEFYKDIDLDTKENTMIWSSSLVRGFDKFYIYVYLPLMKKMPDIKLYVCCGTLGDEDVDLLNRVRLLPGVKVLDKLSKEELAKYQKKSKIWVYPGCWPETFCITAVENAAAGNVLITPLTYGLGTTLKSVKYLNEWNLPSLEKNNAGLYTSLVEQLLKDDNMLKELQKESLELAKKYSWEKAVDEMINIFNK